MVSTTIIILKSRDSVILRYDNNYLKSVQMRKVTWAQTQTNRDLRPRNRSPDKKC